MKYPNLVNYDIAFGENPFYQLNSRTFEYSFTGAASQKFVYYTMAVYQHTWGLTPHTKSSYQIRVIADSAVGPVVQSAMVSPSGQVSEFETVQSDSPMLLTG